MTILFFALEFLVVSVLLLGAARLGTTAVVGTVAAMQLFQTLLSATIYWQVGPEYLVSPGSFILFAGNLAVLLYVYVRGGARAARPVFYAILGANVVVMVLSAVLSLHISAVLPTNFLGLPVEVFSRSLASAGVGIVVLTAAQLVALTAFNALSRRRVPVVVAMSVALVAALVFDTVGYLTPMFWGDPQYWAILEAGVVSKAAGGLVYGIVWGGILQWRSDSHDETVEDLLRALLFRRYGGLKVRLSGQLGIMSEEDFDGWFQQLPDPVCLVVNGVVERANDRFAQAFAFEQSCDAVGVAASEVLPEEVLRQLPGIGEGPATISHELFGGTSVETTATRVGRTRKAGHVIVIHDVSERESLKSQVAHADRLASVGALAAGVAHEVNNPLTFISSNQSLALEMLESIQARVPDDVAQDLALVIDSLEDATDGAERVRKVVSQLMTLARADTDDVELCNLNRIIDSNVSIAKAHINERAELTVDVEELPTIEANAGRLGQVLLNLLLNAAQAVEQVDRDAHTIEVRGWSDSDRVVVKVTDTGPGIPEDIRDQIMEPFFTTKKAGEGTGLGLPTTRSIVEALGGQIYFETTMGEGTTFTVELPLERNRASQTPRLVS